SSADPQCPGAGRVPWLSLPTEDAIVGIRTKPGVINQMDTVFRSKRVIITGGVGFIGSNLARRLVEMEAEVTLVDCLIREYGGNLFNIAGLEDRVRVNISDVRDE